MCDDEKDFGICKYCEDERGLCDRIFLDDDRSCLPSAGHVFLNGNKLTIEISCQLFLNKQYQRHKYG